MSEACAVLRTDRSTYLYRSPQATLFQRIKEIAEARVRCGYRRIHILPKREGVVVNHKKLYRIYRRSG